MLSDTVYNRSSSPDLRGGRCPWKPLALGRTTPALACFHGVLHACVQVSSWKDTSRPGLRTSLLHDLILNSLPLWTPFLKKGASSSNRGWHAYMSFGGTQFRPTTGHMCVLLALVGGSVVWLDTHIAESKRVFMLQSLEIAWHAHFLPPGLHAVERVCWAISPVCYRGRS